MKLSFMTYPTYSPAPFISIKLLNGLLQGVKNYQSVDYRDQRIKNFISYSEFSQEFDSS
jgi:hypothetical protein